MIAPIDLLERKVVASLPRPGANVTGFSATLAGLGGKRIEVLHEAAPRMAISP
jgi:hypothetical protein